MAQSLLVADNSSEFRRSLRSFLEIENYGVEEANSVETAILKLASSAIDLALIDLRLTNDGDPNDISGLEVARFASERGIPCIIMTAFATVEATRSALRSRGAEPPLATDLIPKAEGPHAILDAIRRILSHPSKPIQGLVIEVEQGLAWRKGMPLDLSRQQYDLLSHMYRKKGAVCSPEELLKVVYGEDVPPNQASTDKRLERLIARIREKIEDDPAHPRHLVNVQGRGYLLDVDG